ncbi:cytochrome b/b6 domain-containing protein [Pedobacter psychrodurus]|uniref:cytochrome b/b6 domain-containing protein n=1 Tax=Pedobacter psychrodurus TaxID=2530456 RepID=UPI00293028CE|nr:cytochrome b/b6 domain-containing protein [Pedobacter psychrodurus]
MAIIAPLNQEIGEIKKEKKYASTARFWHWINFIVMAGSLLTVLINSLLFDRTQRTFVKVELMNAGATVNDKQAAAVTHGLEDQVWGIHIYFGYALAALFLFRLIAEFFLPAGQKLLHKLKKAYRAYFILKKEREMAKHELVVKGLYLIFYLLLLTMVVTGLLLAFEDYTNIPENLNHSIKEFHGFCMYLILGFIVLHLAGVFLAERQGGKGIVSDMINGGDDK